MLRMKIKDSESGNETHLSLKPFLKTLRSRDNHPAPTRGKQ